MSETKIGGLVCLGFMSVFLIAGIFHAPLVIPSVGLFVVVPLIWIIETRRVSSWRQLGRVLTMRPLPKAVARGGAACLAKGIRGTPDPRVQPDHLHVERRER